MASFSHSSAAADAHVGFFTRLARRRPILGFIVLAYLLGWLLVAPRVLFSLGLLKFNVPAWWIAASFYAPCIAGFCMQWLTERNLKVCRLYDSWSKLVLGLIVGSALILLSFVIVPALLAETAPLTTLNWHVFLSMASYHFRDSDFLTPIGEELGWRGYALPRLQARFGPLWASLMVGLLWAGFHLPGSVLIQFWSVPQILGYAVGLVALSITMTFAVNISGFSIFVAIVMHTLASSQEGYLVQGLTAHSHPRSHWDWVWGVSNWLVPALIIFLTRGRLGTRRGREA
jgi:membrane protease YdiL (CAAX protease family)